ncbi:MAG: deoxyguanosinetriphosphate triphosphohydrolase family protein [Butyrivibrio sp.]
MGKYRSLSKELQAQIINDREKHLVNPYAFSDENVVRRNMNHDRANLWRPAFVRDIEKIMHMPYYGRYADKTQVFSLYKNDDITRRMQHVQLVSRIARNIGNVLGLNIDLIEAVSLGHDIGHTPFGHAGERQLDKIYFKETGRHFAHNIHSARVLDTIFPLNLSLQTLDGIICHNGEMELKEYKPSPYSDFETFDNRMEECYLEPAANKRLVPATLEACVVRVSDIIAYLGKDRQDAEKLNILESRKEYHKDTIGATNAEIINNMVVNIIENSYGQNYLKMDEDVFADFSNAKASNYELIYGNSRVEDIYKDTINPMFEELYYRLRNDYKAGNEDSPVYTHHINYIRHQTAFYAGKYTDKQYGDNESADDIVTDYIASMTDDYFIDLYNYLFPQGQYKVCYKSYFEK